jgi:hypothetical protein
MTNFDHSDLDIALLDDPLMQRVVSDLERACTTDIPPQRRAAIAWRLDAAAKGLQGALGPARRADIVPIRAVQGRFPRGRIAARVLSLAAAALVALSATFGYQHLQRPSAVSAAALLRHAAAATAGAGEVVHEVTVSHVSGVPLPPGESHFNDVTIEQWTRLNADGNPTAYDLQRSNPAPGLLGSRTVGEANGVLWDVDQNYPSVVGKRSWSPGTAFAPPLPASDPKAILFLLKQTADTPQAPGAMHGLLLAAANGSARETVLLPQQTLGGKTVDVVQVTRTAAEVGLPPASGVAQETLTIYLDASTYLVRRLDMRDLNDKGGTVDDSVLDVTTYEVMPPSAVPAGTFTYVPARGVQVCAAVTFDPAGCAHAATSASR